MGNTASPQDRPVRSQYYEEGTEEEQVGILSFEVSNLSSRLLSLRQIVQPVTLEQIRREVLESDGVEKLITTDREKKLRILKKEILDDLKSACATVARLARRSADPAIQKVHEKFAKLFSDGGAKHAALSEMEMEAQIYNIELLVAATGQLYHHMAMRDGLLGALENLKEQETFQQGLLTLAIQSMERRIAEEVQHIKDLQDSSFWTKKLDGIVHLFVDMIFTIHGRTIAELGPGPVPPSPPPSPSLSPKMKRVTLGDVGLSLHYANLIIKLEDIHLEPRRLTDISRAQVFGMVPERLKMVFRTQMAQEVKQEKTTPNDSDSKTQESGGGKMTVDDWDRKVEDIINWLGKMAHATVKRQAERNFEAHLTNRRQIILLETLFLADRDKTESLIVDLLVGISLIVKRERQLEAEEMDRAMKKLLEHSPFDDLGSDGG